MSRAANLPLRQTIAGMLALLATLAPGAALLAQAPARPELAPGSRYVAMGSSYAAGLTVGEPADGPARCGRGSLAYPVQLAQKLALTLVNATCSGSTTEHILGPWKELPPQLEAVTPDTRLVTITSGGNDIGFVRNLGAIGCPTLPEASRPGPCWTMQRASEADWTALEERMRRIVVEIRQRAPEARIVFVDYLTVIPPKGGCQALPGPAAELAASRADALRLAEITARVAKEGGAELLRVSRLTVRHNACSRVPWTYGITAPPGKAPLHPGELLHTRVADALAALLTRRP